MGLNGNPESSIFMSPHKSYANQTLLLTLPLLYSIYIFSSTSYRKYANFKNIYVIYVV